MMMSLIFTATKRITALFNVVKCQDASDRLTTLTTLPAPGWLNAPGDEQWVEQGGVASTAKPSGSV